jgi:hypothetical protein
MVSWYETIVSPLKTAGETAKKAMEIRDTVKFGEITANLYKQIMASYEAAISVKEREAQLIEENNALKKRIVELEANHARMESYELKTLPPGILVRAPKQGTEEARTPHYACETCYQRGIVAKLQSGEVRHGIVTLTCTECDAKLKSGHFQPPQVNLARGTDFDVFR